MKKLAALATVTAALTAPALAADTVNMSVTASVAGVCKFVSTSPLAFGTLTPSKTAPAVPGSSSVSFWCTKGAGYTLSAGNGLYYDSVLGKRRMKGPGPVDYIPYTLTLASLTGTGLGASTDLTVNVIAEVLGDDYKDATIGSYADTVQFSIAP